MAEKGDASEATNSRAIIAGFAVAAVGVIVLYLSACAEAGSYLKTGSVLRELGSFLVVGVVLALFWELFGRRQFTNEILEKIGMARALSSAGVTKITMNFRNESVMDWGDLFGSSRQLDMWAAYASTWRKNHIDKIDAFLTKENARLRIALPDPQNDETVSHLAARFQQTPAELKANIEATVREFLALGHPEKVEIYLCSKIPVFTFYKFDNSAVLAFYNHRSGRLTPPPAIVCSNDGTFYQYLTDEFAGITEGARRAE